ncbi:MAG: SRPBCC domain-containing protein [Ignavibacteriaceae bacterium]
MGKELVLQKSIEINADLPKVWDALTNPDWTVKYMHGLEVISDWEEGSPIVWKGISDGKDFIRKGRVLKKIPGKYLRISDFNPNSGLPDVEFNYSIVTYELSTKNNFTLLQIKEENL